MAKKIFFGLRFVKYIFVSGPFISVYFRYTHVSNHSIDDNVKAHNRT
jgi:hypothetical protein